MSTQRYTDSSEAAWSGFRPYVASLLGAAGVRRICEIGAGANPTFPLDELPPQAEQYTLLDIAPEELAKAPAGYETLVGDIGSPRLNVEGGFDLMFSRMLAEHVKDGPTFHRNVFDLLRPGGMAFHFFPTMFAPPFVVNRLMPEELAARVLRVLQPGRDLEGKQRKFPAFYSMCYGPTPSQIQRFENIGYEVAEYHSFYGHPGYYKQVPLLMKAHTRLAKGLERTGTPYLTSFAWVKLVRPEN